MGERAENMQTGQGWHRLCRLIDLSDDGSGQAFELGSVYVAAFRVGQEVHVIADSCPHAGASLSLGLLSHGEVTCPAHAMHFDLRTGCSSDGAGERVRVWQTRIDQSGWIEVRQ